MSSSSFERLARSIRQMKAIQQGKMKPARVTVFTPLDVQAIRARLKFSQSEFAAALQVPVSTLQGWEQGRRQPRGPTRTLLRIVEKNPNVLIDLAK